MTYSVLKVPLNPNQPTLHPCKFQRVSRLGSVTAKHCSSGRQPNFAALTVGATYIQQGGHHVGHWPTF